jgi:hypothetical protein
MKDREELSTWQGRQTVADRRKPGISGKPPPCKPEGHAVEHARDAVPLTILHGAAVEQ